MALEKKFRAVSPQPFTQDGTSSGVIKVTNASLFKIEQLVTLKSDTQSNLLLQIRDIPNKTTIIVGPREGPPTVVTDLSLYTTLDSSTIESSIQVRPQVLLQDVERATYEEAPTVARRVYLVDVLGQGISDSNPLPVEDEGIVSSDVVRFRNPYSTANVEESQVLPDGTKKLYVGVEGLNAKIRVSFTSGGTTTLGDDYTTEYTGNSYWRQGLNLVGKTLYYQSSKSGVVFEIEAWV